MTEENKQQLGNDHFAYAQNPQDTPECYLLNEDTLEPAQLVALEADMHARSLSWLRSEFKKAGLVEARTPS